MLDAHIIKRRRDFAIDVALHAHRGEAVGLFGASGAGKSTVLSCIAGLEQPDRGYVRLGEMQLFPPPLALHRRPIGYLTQGANLFPHLSVRDNVCFGLARRRAAEEEAWLSELRERLGLERIWRVAASRISGGQARRVALARMLARRPPLVLLDEPFTGLDRHVVRELIDDLLIWQRGERFTMIVVDHQAQVVERLCPRAVVIENGHVVQHGTWDELYGAPATPLLAQLLKPL
jgi:molybdate transport system ATP-binding protein